MSKKRGLDRLQQEVEIPAVVQRRAQNAFDQIHREAKLADQGVISMDREAGRKEQTMKKRGRRTKRAVMVVVFAAVMILGTMTVAVAAYRGRLSEGIKKLFHISEEQEEDLLNREDGLVHIMETEGAEKVEKNENESEDRNDLNDDERIISDTHQGITVFLKETIVDSCCANIVLQVDGIPKEYEDQLDVLNVELWVAGEPLHSGDAKEVVLENGSREIVIYRNMANNKEPGWHLGQQIEVVWKDMELYLGDGNRRMIVEDTWILKWTLEGSDQNISLQMDVPLGDTGATVREIMISPISVYIVYDFARETVSFQTDKGNVGGAVKTPPVPHGVIMKDGTEYMPAISGGSDGHYGDQTEQYMVVRKWWYLMDPDKIESIIFLDEDSRETYIVPLSQASKN